MLLQLEGRPLCVVQDENLEAEYEREKLQHSYAENVVPESRKNRHKNTTKTNRELTGSRLSVRAHRASVHQRCYQPLEWPPALHPSTHDGEVSVQESWSVT